MDPLTNLLNRSAEAYTFFYSLTPQIQQTLRQREISTLPQLHSEAERAVMELRPKVF